MKRALKVTLLAITAFVTIASISGCKVDEGGIYGAFPYMNVPFTDTLLSKVEQTITIPIETNRTIGANVTDALWLKARTEGNNLILTALKNEQETQRTANVEVYTVNSTVKTNITVVQSASGELTIIGDLILPYANEVEENTYTKTTGSLIVGKVTSMTPASVSSAIAASLHATPAANSENVFVRFNNQILEVVPTDISNRHVNILTEKIHMIGSRSLAIINTNVSAFPYKLTYDNNVKNLCLAACSFQEIPSMDSLKALNLRDLNLAYNNLTSVSSIRGLDSLTRLDIAYNNVEDITALSENANIEELVLDGNPITNIEVLGQLENLKKLSLKELPILPTQYELLVENLPEGCITDTTGLKSEESPLVLLGTPSEISHDETSITLEVPVLNIGGSNITNQGYYWGNSRKFNQMEHVEGVYNEADGTVTATISNVDPYSQVYFFRGYAENSAGRSFSVINRFGDIILDGNYYIRNNTEFNDFYEETITQIKGSLFIGNTVDYSDDSVITITRDTTLHFSSGEITSLDKLSNLSYVEKGLFIVHTGIQSANGISGIDHAATIWLEGNKLTSVPDMSHISGLKSVNVARNQITNIEPLLKLGNIDTLYLGNSQYPYNETNNIGVLTGLETMENLKYLDLSGLPVHSWQVEDLRSVMPNCNIVFTPGNRSAFLPTLQTDAASISGSQVTIRGTLANKGEGQIIDYGFYWGKDKDNLTRVSVGTNDIETGKVFELTLNIPDEDRYYYQPYAVNTYGEANSRDYREFTLSFINLSERGTSNSYIVSNAGRYTFKANVIGNGSAGIIDTANFHTSDVNIYPTNAGLVWQTSDDIIQDIEFLSESQEILITTSGKEGNALVAAIDGNNNILWSWHIWCTDKPVDHKYINYNGQRFTVQDRNLGATRADRGTGEQWRESCGLAYQWGRKDPFAHSHNTEKYGTQFTIMESIENPTYIPSGYEQWTAHDISQNMNLWHPTVKTIYDPCPAGYKVASIDAWSGFSKTGNTQHDVSYINYVGSYDHGYNFIYDGTNTAWYPTATDHNGYFEHGGIWSSSYQEGPNVSYAGGYIFEYHTTYITYYCTTGLHMSRNIRCMEDIGFNDLRYPTLTSDEVTDITSNSVRAVGYITSEGKSAITARGFVWSKYDHPTLSDSHIEVEAGEDGFMGKFEVMIGNLESGTTYYIRPYATNSQGTGYGKPMKIKTKDGGSSEDVGRDDDFEW